MSSYFKDYDEVFESLDTLKKLCPDVEAEARHDHAMFIRIEHGWGLLFGPYDVYRFVEGYNIGKRMYK